MLIFMKNAKRFLGKGDRLSALHYHAGRVCAANPHSVVWVEAVVEREGSFNAETGAPVEKAVPPDLDRVFPRLPDPPAYAIVEAEEFAKILAVLKAVDACAPDRKHTDHVMLVWRNDGLRMYARGQNLRAEYVLAGKTENLAADRVLYAVFSVKLLLPIIEYFRQRKAPVLFYATPKIRTPLRMDVDTKFSTPSGAVLAPTYKIEEGRWKDVIPVAELRKGNENL